MRKTINGKDYYLPSNLTPEQEEIYCHTIDWKRANITKERGVYKGNEYDALFPDNTEYPRMHTSPVQRIGRYMHLYGGI